MSRQGRLWRVLLSHHGEAEDHHCYHVPLPGGRRGVCARCLGLYPTLVLTIVFESTVWRFESEWRWMWAFGLVTPAVIDWSRSKLFGSRGTNRVRTLTGVLAGLGLGVAFSDYFRDSSSGYFWSLIGVLTFVIALVWWCRPTGQQDPE